MFDALQWLADWFGGSGIAGFFAEWWGWAIQKLTVWWLELKIEAMKFAWGIAKGILQDLQVGQRITNSLTMLPADMRAAINFFRAPEALTNLLTAYVTRFVMRFIPGL